MNASNVWIFVIETTALFEIVCKYYLESFYITTLLKLVWRVQIYFHRIITKLYQNFKQYTYLHSNIELLQIPER